MEEISIDEIFTSYKVLGWQGQLRDDPSQTFRTLRALSEAEEVEIWAV
jgi:hypothetical protein